MGDQTPLVAKFPESFKTWASYRMKEAGVARAFPNENPMTNFPGDVFNPMIIRVRDRKI